LKDQGYRVIELSKEANDYGAEKLEDTSLDSVINHLRGCEFYIGLSSGISWLAWAVNAKVVMVANFTEANHEFECIRIDNRKVCNGCWNNPYGPARKIGLGVLSTKILLDSLNVIGVYLLMML